MHNKLLEIIEKKEKYLMEEKNKLYLYSLK
jgi:hypothetical protein